MALIGNLLWLLLGGFFFALGWFLGGILLCCTVIGIPFGIASFRIGFFALMPFGHELVPAEVVGERRIAGTWVANLVWVILAGLWLAIAHFVLGIGCCLSIIGIPLGIIHFKLAGASFAPLGKRVVSKSDLRRRAARGSVR